MAIDFVERARLLDLLFERLGDVLDPKDITEIYNLISGGNGLGRDASEEELGAYREMFGDGRPIPVPGPGPVPWPGNRGTPPSTWPGGGRPIPIPGPGPVPWPGGGRPIPVPGPGPVPMGLDIWPGGGKPVPIPGPGPVTRPGGGGKPVPVPGPGPVPRQPGGYAAGSANTGAGTFERLKSKYAPPTQKPIEHAPGGGPGLKQYPVPRKKIAGRTRP